MLNYRDIVNKTEKAEADRHQLDVDKATQEHTIKVERALWIKHPVTQDFLLTVRVRIEELQQAAESFALSGDSAKCQIATIQATTLRNIISNYAG